VANRRRPLITNVLSKISSWLDTPSRLALRLKFFSVPHVDSCYFVTLYSCFSDSCCAITSVGVSGFFNSLRGRSCSQIVPPRLNWIKGLGRGREKPGFSGPVGAACKLSEGLLATTITMACSILICSHASVFFIYVLNVVIHVSGHCGQKARAITKKQK